MSDKKGMRWMKHYDFILCDLLCMVVSFFVGCLIRNGSFNPVFNQYRNLLVFFVLLDITVLFFDETYSGVLKRDFLKELRSTFEHALFVFLLVALYMTLAKVAGSTSRIMFVVIIVLYTITTFICRCLLKMFIGLKAKKALHDGKTSLIILTENSYVESITNEISIRNFDDYNVSGLCILDADRKGEVINGFAVVENKAEVLEYVCREWVDEVLIIAKHPEEYMNLTKGFSEMGITQNIRMSFDDSLAGNYNSFKNIGSEVFLTSAVRVASNRQLFLKKCMDIIGGLIGCLMTIVLMIIFFPIVQIKSPGPLLYSSERIGKNGKRFKFYKFRSMVVDADSKKESLMDQNRVKDGMMFKIDHDPRIIPGYGEFIRKTSLDEFPQFFNVLKGDMSLVGTRPPTPDEWEKYKLHHRVRLSVKPGITGMWQTSGRSNITDFEEVVKLDSYYVHNWDLGLDVKLLCKTVINMFCKEGAM